MVCWVILLRNRGDIVGFGKYVLDSEAEQPTEKIHGHYLRQFAKGSEHLVAVHGIQIFTELRDKAIHTNSRDSMTHQSYSVT